MTTGPHEAIDEQGENEDEEEPTGEGEEPGETPAEPTTHAPRPRARRAANVSAVAAGVPLGRFGAVPKDVTHWMVRRRGVNGDWESLGYTPPDALAELSWFPLAELSEETLSKRWGPGLYDISWVRPLANGGRSVLRGGCEVRIVAQPVAPPAPAPAAIPGGDSFSLALQIMNMIEEQSTAKINGMAQLAGLMTGQQSRGLGGAELELILTKQAAATRDLIAAAVAPLQQQVAELSAARDEEDEEDEEDDEDDRAAALQAVAGAAAPAIFKGNKWWQQLGAYASQNPEVAKAVAPVALGAVQTVITALSSAMQTAQPPRPRATHVPPAPPPPPAEPPANALHGAQPNGDVSPPPERVVVPPKPGTATAAAAE